ncbi:MAG: endonuclease V, partial [Nitrospiria bacterium]
PPLLKVFEKIEHEPDLILFDGQGIAHPRGMGIASHAGLLLDKPSIGCAKSLLFGHFEEPGVEQGSYSYLYDDDNRVIGSVVRTRTGIQPVFVSIGHRLDLLTAIKFVLACSCGYRIPDPIRQAHHFVNRLRQSKAQTAQQTNQLSLLHM